MPRIRVARFGPPEDQHRNILQRGSIPAGEVPVLADFDHTQPIGRAVVHVDGTADLELEPGLVVDVARLVPDTTIGIGFRVLESHVDGDVRVIERLELLTLSIDRRVLRSSRP